MVDFNNENTITRPAVDIVRVLVLEKREDCLQALKGFNKQTYLNADPPDVDFRSRVSIFFEELRSHLKRSKPGIEEEIQGLLKGSFQDVLKAFRIMNDALDDIQLTRLDYRRTYDTTRAEIENEIKGL